MKKRKLKTEEQEEQEQEQEDNYSTSDVPIGSSGSVSEFMLENGRRLYLKDLNMENYNNCGLLVSRVEEKCFFSAIEIRCIYFTLYGCQWN
jgi:hypothetical protein